MKPILISLLAVGVLAGSAPAPAAPRTPVIVELFTSEGCSSCPPADILLSQLSERQPVPGVDVIALGEHVDYWNHGGWADRFSSPQFSARQSDYSAAFRLNTVYTPQMVVDGRDQFNGSDEEQARSAIARAARQPKAQVQITPESVLKSALNTDYLLIEVSRLPVSVKSDPAEVYLVVTEDGLRSAVGGGENAGQHLQHSAVVRQLIRLGEISGGAFNSPINVKLPPSAQRENVHVVVFVQQQNSRRIIGAAEVPFT